MLFNILTLGEFIHDEGIETAIGSFAELYHNVTSKHQKKIRLKMITKGLQTEEIKAKAKNYNIADLLELVFWDDQTKVEEVYRDSSVMLLPAKGNISKLVSEAFSYSLPIISFENESLFDIVDYSNGLLISEENRGENIEEFSEMLRILYFDPEARKILQRGALKKYEDALSWGDSVKRQTSRSLAA